MICCPGVEILKILVIFYLSDNANNNFYFFRSEYLPENIKEVIRKVTINAFFKKMKQPT